MMDKGIDARKAVTQKIVAMFNTGDLSEANALFSTDYVDHQRPDWLDKTGPEEFKQIVISARRSLPNLRVTIEALIAEEDTVAARLHWHSALANGTIIDRETLDMLRFVKGKVVEHWGAETWTTAAPQSEQPDDNRHLP